MLIKYVWSGLKTLWCQISIPNGHKTLCASLPRHMLQARQYLSAGAQMDRNNI